MQKKHKKQDTVYSQGMQMDHTSDVPQEKTFTQTQVFPHNHSRRLCLIHSLCFIRDVIQKKAKTSSLNFAVLLYAALSPQLLSFMTHDNFTTKNSFILFFLFLGFVKVPCLVFLLFFVFLGETKTVYLPAKQSVCKKTFLTALEV